MHLQVVIFSNKKSTTKFKSAQKNQPPNSNQHKKNQPKFKSAQKNQRENSNQYKKNQPPNSNQHKKINEQIQIKTKIPRNLLEIYLRHVEFFFQKRMHNKTKKKKILIDADTKNFPRFSRKHGIVFKKGNKVSPNGVTALVYKKPSQEKILEILA